MTDCEALLKSIPLPPISGLSGIKVFNAFVAGAEGKCVRGKVGSAEIAYLLAAVSCCKLHDADAAVKHMSVAILREFWAAVEAKGRGSKQKRRQASAILMAEAIGLSTDLPAGRDGYRYKFLSRSHGGAGRFAL